MNDPFNNIERLQLPTPSAPTTITRQRTPRHRPGERFLRGPISWPWLGRAARCPGQALAVGLALWYLAGMKKSKTVRLSTSMLRVDLGVQCDAVRRGLTALESAHLVSVERHVGRKPVVTILDMPEEVLE